MIYALVSLHEAVDLIGVSAVTVLGAYGWSRLRAKDRQRRIERKERQAEFSRKLIRAERDRAEALRYFGTGVR